MSRVAYYPGCSLHGTATELDSSFVGTAAKLGVDLVEIPGWECCGNTAAHATNRLLATALPANEMAKVKDDMGLERVAVPCAACFARFMATNHDVQDDETAHDVAQVVGRRYDGGVGVLNLVDFYHDEVGLGGPQGQGHPALRRSQGGGLLRLPADPPAQGHPRRGPRVPDPHGRAARGPGLRARRVDLQDRLLRRLAGALRAGRGGRAGAQDRRQRPRPAAPRRSPAPARSARSTSTPARATSKRPTRAGSTCRSSI